MLKAPRIMLKAPRIMLKAPNKIPFDHLRQLWLLSSSGENNISYERAQRVSKILFLTREDKSHMFKLPCNVLFTIYSPKQKIVKFHAQKQIGKSHVIDIFTGEDM